MQWKGYVWLDTGYASELRSFVLALDGLGVNVVPVVEELIHEVVGFKSFAKLPLGVSTRLSQLAARRAVPGRSRLAVVHHGNTAFQNMTGADLTSYHIFRGVWETANQSFADRLESCWQADEIWVPSRHTHDILVRGGVPAARIRHVPQGMDFAAFPHDAKPYPLPAPGDELRSRLLGAGGPFTFLSVFAWSRRKGWDILLSAFVAEFPPGSGVRLVLKVSGFRSNTLAEVAKQRDAHLAARGLAALPANVVWLDASLTERELAGLYRAADAFVLPTRAEGWGRPFMEAMAMGLPVIGTGWGGHMDFMDASNAYLLRYRLVPALREFDHFDLRNHLWAEVPPEHLRDVMRAVVADPEQARALGRRAAEHVRTAYSQEAVARTALDNLRTAARRLGCACTAAAEPAACGRHALEAGRPADAVACFREALFRGGGGADPAARAEALLGLSVAYFLDDRLVLASHGVRSSIALCPQVAALFGMETLDEELLRQAFLLCPTVRVAMLAQGYIFLAAKEPGDGPPAAAAEGEGPPEDEDSWKIALFAASAAERAHLCRTARMLSRKLRRWPGALPTACRAGGAHGDAE